MSMVKILTLTIDEALIEDYDEFWKRKGYLSRADAMRTAMREQMLRDHLRRNSD